MANSSYIKKLLAMVILAISWFSFNGYSVEPTCDADEAARWKYLWQNPSLNVRQLIATGYLKSKGIKTVIEIGGYCTPICKYVPDIKYINIDPAANSNPAICTDATLIKKGFEDMSLKDLQITKPFALVALGIYWESLKKTADLEKISFLNEIMQEATVVVTESTYPVKWIRDQAGVIGNLAKRYGFKKQVDINIDIQGPRPMNNVFYRHMNIYYRE